MNDELKGKCFRDLLVSEVFAAELTLEADVRTSLLADLMRLDLNDQTVSLQYAKIRGALDVLNTLQKKREHLAEQARSRTNNS